MSITLSRRSLLLGISGVAALALAPKIASAQGFTVKGAFAEPKPPKRTYKHYFAFDHGIYAANITQNAKLKMGEVKKDSHNPMFIDGLFETPPKAWEPRIDNGYPNVILDENGTYHCYYTLFTKHPTQHTPRAERSKTEYPTKGERKVGLAYARSKDGIVWEKPNLGIVEFEGSRENNLLMLDVAGTGVLYEPNEPDPQKRFKLITRKEENKKLAVAFSQDGLHFSPLVEWPENNTKFGADCHNSVFRDSRTKQYILTTRLWANNLRVVAQSRSDDFITWSPFEEILRGNGYEDQVYSMTVFEYNDIYFGFASVYKQDDIGEVDFDTHTLQLYWSTNLTEWNRAVPENNVLIPFGAGREKFLDGEFDSASQFASAMTAGDNRIYYTGSRGRHRNWRETGLGLAYADRNKFVGLVERHAGKRMSFGINPLKFHGEKLEIWADIAEGGKFAIHIQGKEGFEADKCQMEKQPNGAYRVSWAGKSLIEASKDEKLGIGLRITAEKATFWGISGEFEMDERSYWRA